MWIRSALSICLFILACSGSLAGSVAEDRQALEALYTSSSGTSWSNNANWLSSEPLSEWFGVDTDENGRVVRLDLYENNLVGALPEEIGLLDELQYLNIKKNSLTGSIPDSVGNLESIEWLLLSGQTSDGFKDPNIALNRANHPGKSDTSGNSFSGPVPESLGNLQNMIVLQLSGSQTCCGLPESIGNASSLVAIFTSWNQNWTEPIPDSIGQLENLAHLYLSRNQMTGVIPASTKNLKELRYMHFGNGNSFEGHFPDWSGLTYLRTVGLDSNDFTGPFPNYMIDGTLPDIFGLNMAWNDWEGPLSENVQPLKTLTITGHSMTGQIPASVFTSMMINTNFGWGEFSGELPRDLRHMRNIRNLRFPDNYLEGPWPDLDWTNKQGRSSHPLSSFTRAQFGNNKFVPADMLILSDDNRTLFSWYKQYGTASFNYGGQKPFGDSVTASVSEGGRFVFNYSHKAHPDDVFVWFKDGEVLVGKDGFDLVIDPVSSSDAGVYTLQITNPYPDISSEIYVSEPIKLVVNSSGSSLFIGGSSDLHPAWQQLLEYGVVEEENSSEQEEFDTSLYASPRESFTVSDTVRSTDTVTYGTGYYSYDGLQWSSFSFDQDTRNGWVVGPATSSSAPLDAKYYAAFSCSWNNEWACEDTWQVLEQ